MSNKREEPFILICFENIEATEKLAIKLQEKGPWKIFPVHGYLNFMHIVESLNPDVIITTGEWRGLKTSQETAEYLKKICPESKIFIISSEANKNKNSINIENIINLLTDKADDIIHFLRKVLPPKESQLQCKSRTVVFGQKFMADAEQRFFQKVHSTKNRWDQ